MSGWAQAAAVLLVVAVVYVPLGNHLARVYTSTKHSRAERVIYRLIRVDPEREQTWQHYLGSLLAFSLVGVLALYALLRMQTRLPLSLGHPAVDPALAFNTAVSFVTNTSWQSYAGESTLGHLAQMAGLGTQAFASAAVSMCAGVALVRGLVRKETDKVGNFWVDVTRSVTRVLLPLAFVVAVVLVVLGVVQNLYDARDVTTIAGTQQHLLGGPVASWEPIKLLSGDGGGFFNANSAHPFENPSPVSNIVEIVLMLLIPTAFLRMYGKLVDDTRQGWALLAVVAVLFIGSLAVTSGTQAAHPGTVPAAVGVTSEGTELRFGPTSGALFGTAATATADGAANASYDSFTSIGGGVLLVNMMLGEVSPGGAGSGLYGLLMACLLAVFIGGLMVGRTPEFLRKRIGRREITLISLYTLATPTAVLLGSAVAAAAPEGRAGPLNSGPHGMSEIVYAFTSAGNSNGSAFAGISANTSFYNVALALVMLAGRYLPIIFVIALAGRFAGQRRGVVTAGTLATHNATFVFLVIGVVLLVSALTFLPALALGPLADALP